MVRFTAVLMMLILQAAASTWTQSPQTHTLVITRGGSRPVEPGPEANFTGSVRVERLFEAVDPSHSSGGFVTFEPGARTAWHLHPGGQILIVTAGTGRVQLWGHPMQEVRVGDVVTIPAGVKHWHGASPQAPMPHLGITEARDGNAVEWMEKVSDEQYNAVSPSSSPQSDPTRPSGPLQQKLAPGMAALTDDVLYGDVWKRAELSPRDRSLVTITTLIATGRSAVLAGHLSRALDNGVTPGEASGLLAHLAIYCGWPNAVAALDAYDQVYTARKVDSAALHDARSHLPSAAGESARAKELADSLGSVAPKFVQLTNDVVFDDLWRRPDLTPRDRGLVTVAALAAMGDDDQLDFYLHRAIESGLTRAQIAEAFTHVGFYAGWGKATRAMTVVARTFTK